MVNFYSHVEVLEPDNTLSLTEIRFDDYDDRNANSCWDALRVERHSVSSIGGSLTHCPMGIASLTSLEEDQLMGDYSEGSAQLEDVFASRDGQTSDGSMGLSQIFPNSDNNNDDDDDDTPTPPSNHVISKAVGEVAVRTGLQAIVAFFVRILSSSQNDIDVVSTQLHDNGASQTMSQSKLMMSSSKSVSLQVQYVLFYFV
jgi:hypothetical protein